MNFSPFPLPLLCPGLEQIVSEMSVQLERFVDIDPRPTGDGVRCCPKVPAVSGGFLELQIAIFYAFA